MNITDDININYSMNGMNFMDEIYLVDGINVIFDINTPNNMNTINIYENINDSYKDKSDNYNKIIIIKIIMSIIIMMADRNN